MSPRAGFGLLRVEDLRASWDGAVDVLHGVSIEVREHEIVTILGSNGAGKSTLANAVSGVVPFVRGRISFAGEGLAGLPAHEIVARGVAQVPSGRAIFPDMTVLENLLVGAHAYRSDRARVRRNAAAMLERFPVLAQRRRQPAGTLSGGEQQLLSIARGLMARPRLMILDEPSMGLAPATVARVFDVIRDVWAEGTTLLLVEKLARLALELSDHLYVFELGRCTLEGSPDELAADPRVEEAYLGRRAWAEIMAGVEAEPAERGQGADRPGG